MNESTTQVIKRVCAGVDGALFRQIKLAERVAELEARISSDAEEIENLRRKLDSAKRSMADRIRELEARVPTGHTGSDAAPPRGQKWTQGSYGFCPQCGAPGKLRERRPNGIDICENGHNYPSSTSRIVPLKAPEALQEPSLGDSPARGEAVAWAVYDSDGAFVDVRKNAESAERARGCGDTIVPLYTTPVAAVVSEAERKVVEAAKVWCDLDRKYEGLSRDAVVAGFLTVTQAERDARFRADVALNEVREAVRALTAARGGA